MAKRQRAVRSGQRKPTTRTTPATAPTAAVVPTPATSVTPSEEARAAELEAEILAQESAAGAAASRSRGRRGGADASRGRPREAAALASRSTAEYAYVVADLKRIAVVASGLFILMIAIWAIVAATGSLKL